MRYLQIICELIKVWVWILALWRFGMYRHFATLFKRTRSLSFVIFAVTVAFLNLSNASAVLTVDVYGNKQNKVVTIALHKVSASPENEAMVAKISSVIIDDLNHTGLAVVNSLHDEVSLNFMTKKDESFLGVDAASGYEYSITGILLRDASDKGKFKIEIKGWKVSSKDCVFTRSFVFREDVMRKAAHMVADTIMLHSVGIMGYFNSKIMYVATDTSVAPGSAHSKSIGILDQDGFNKRYITPRSLVITPFYSHHLKKIIFVSYSNGSPRIKLMSIVDGVTEDLGDFLEEFKGVTVVSPRVSPDGTELMFSAMNQRAFADLYKVDLKTKRIKRLTHAGLNVSPSYSPDGKQVVYSSDKSGKQSIYIITNEGEEVRRVVYGPGAYQEPAWSPDGKWIAFTKIYRGNFYIGIMTPSGEKERILGTGYLAESPSWSPNSQEVIFSFQKTAASKSQLKVVSISGKELRTINTPDSATDPFWFVPS